MPHNNIKGEDRTMQNGIVEEEGTISDKEGTASLRIEEQGSPSKRLNPE